jgi:hypothetical protein
MNASLITSESNLRLAFRNELLELLITIESAAQKGEKLFALFASEAALSRIEWLECWQQSLTVTPPSLLPTQRNEKLIPEPTKCHKSIISLNLREYPEIRQPKRKEKWKNEIE